MGGNRMKKILIYTLAALVLLLLVLLLLVLPFITGNIEKEELNSETRALLGESFIELSDGFTHYELKGEKDAETIILIHGNAAPYFTWDYNFDVLVEAGFRVLRYDMFGHGYSDRPNIEAYNRDFYDRQLLELKEKLEIKDPIYLVGTSQGGSICAYFASNHPGKVKKIAFLSPLFDEFEGKNMLGILKSKFVGEYFMCVLGDRFLTDPSKVLHREDKKEELIEKLRKQLHYIGKRKAVLANLRGNAINDASIYYEKIKELDISFLLTWGENDKSISQESMNRLCELIPNIKYHQIKDASHLAHYEFSKEINSLLIEFFKNT